MQSDKYGDVGDLTRAVRVATPAGMLATRPVPSTSTGPSVREMILGSEGRLGVITEATVHVHRVPAERKILGYLFPDWERGLAALRAIAESEASPSVTRVSDAYETAFSFATRKRSTKVDRAKSKALRTFLERRRGYDLSAMCLAFIGFEGSAEARRGAAQARRADREPPQRRRHRLGPGELYDQKKFDTPYIRDFLLDRGAPADVSETAAPWRELPKLYGAAMAAAHGAFAGLGVDGYIMCHLSHSYHAGACLYFTFAIKPSADARRARGVRHGEGRDPAVVRRLRRARSRTITRSAPSTRAGSSRTSRPPAPRSCGRCSTASTPGGNLNPGKIVPSRARERS